MGFIDGNRFGGSSANLQPWTEGDIDDWEIVQATNSTGECCNLEDDWSPLGEEEQKINVPLDPPSSPLCFPTLQRVSISVDPEHWKDDMSATILQQACLLSTTDLKGEAPSASEVEPAKSGPEECLARLKILFDNYRLLTRAPEPKYVSHAPGLFIKRIDFPAYSGSGELKKFEAGDKVAVLMAHDEHLHPGYLLGIIEGYRRQGLKVFVFDCVCSPGLGRGGVQGIQAFSNAEQAFLLFLSEGFKPNQIILHGYSLAAFPSIRIAANHKVKLVLDRAAMGRSDEAMRRPKMAYANMPEETKELFANTSLLDVNSRLLYLSGIEDHFSRIKGDVFIVQEEDRTTRSLEEESLTASINRWEETRLSFCKKSFWKVRGKHSCDPCKAWTVDGKGMAETLRIRYESPDSPSFKSEKRNLEAYPPVLKRVSSFRPGPFDLEKSEEPAAACFSREAVRAAWVDFIKSA